MEGSSSRSRSTFVTPNLRASASPFASHSRSPSVESLLASLPKLSLAEGRVDRNWGGASRGNNSVGVPSDVSLVDTQQFEVYNDLQYATGLGYLSQFQSGVAQREWECLRPLNSQNIWAYDNFSNGEGFLDSNLYPGPGSYMSLLNYGNRHNLDQRQNNFVGNLTRHTMSTNSGFITPSISDCAAQFEGNPFLDNLASPSLGRRDYMLHNNLNMYPTIASQYSSLDCPYEAIGMNDLYWGKDLDNSSGTSGSLLNQETLNTVGPSALLQGTDMVTLAMSKNGSLYLQNFLSSRDPEITNKIVDGLLESIFKLMTDESGQYIFQKLIECCDDYQMQRIVQKIVSQNSLLIDASLNRIGSLSIEKLIKVLKKSPLIGRMTSALANEFCKLMTHPTGRNVILRCLKLLNSQQNEVLYEAAIQHFIALATHQKGCLSLKECIKYIRGPHRNHLLHAISQQTVFLSQDPVGNYVMQLVLELQNPDITPEICSKLQGHYVRLSLQQCGSKVVENCLLCGGMENVVEELVTADNILQISKDEYGNYVIQNALKITKCKGSKYHQKLLWALEPHLPSLEFHPYGKYVFKLIKDGVPVQ